MVRQRVVFGVGVDICKVARIERLINKGPYYKERFLTGVFHPTEIAAYEKKEVDAVKVQYLASRFALKEAMVKASGRTDIEYPGVYLSKPDTPRAKPQLAVCGELNERIFGEELGIVGMHASVSHEEDYAVAFVTLETELKPL